MKEPRRRSTLTRRVPPLVMGGVALALMIAVLPSSLHLPVTGPGSQAEVAPVPGQGNSQANLSALGLADSGTVGSGGAGALADGSNPLPSPVGDLLQALPGTVRVASNVRCIGNPPRQTEDPLSPPCVAFWSGNNGGNTTKGVTGSAITIVLVSMNTGHDGVHYEDSPAANDDPYDTTARVLLRYFQTRFQTYNRAVKLISVLKGNGFKDIEAMYHPFAVIEIGSMATTGNPDADAAKAGTMTFTAVDRTNAICAGEAQLIANAPYQWCLGTSTRSDISALAHYVCGGLVGRPAAISADPTIKVKTRRFGILANAARNVQPAKDALKQQCGLDPQYYPVDATAADIGRMEADGITTLINGTDATMSAAAKANYTPEWLAVNQLNGNIQRNQRTSTIPVTEWNSYFGLSSNWRWRPRPQPYYYQAAQSVSASTQPDSSWGSSIYYGLLMAFTAIQMSGHNLTAANAARAMQGFTAAYDPPFSPHAGYAPGDYNFLDDYMIERWDSSGNPPDSAGAGCFRLTDGGKRYLPTDPWPSDDRAAATDATQPCQTDEIHQNDIAADSNHN